MLVTLRYTANWGSSDLCFYDCIAVDIEMDVPHSREVPILPPPQSRLPNILKKT